MSADVRFPAIAGRVLDLLRPSGVAMRKAMIQCQLPGVFGDQFEATFRDLVASNQLVREERLGVVVFRLARPDDARATAPVMPAPTTAMARYRSRITASAAPVVSAPAAQPKARIPRDSRSVVALMKRERVLAVLADGQWHRQVEIRLRADLTAGSTQFLLDSLQRDGIVERVGVAQASRFRLVRSAAAAPAGVSP